jgi:hypothetical protein
MNRLIAKQLKSYPQLDKAARIAYYEPTPGNQVHTDTMFWKESGLTGNANPIPILVIVDVATRFTKVYVQKTKNDNVLAHFKDFKKALKKRFPRTASGTVLVTDGAKELSKPFENEPGCITNFLQGSTRLFLLKQRSAKFARSSVR